MNQPAAAGAASGAHAVLTTCVTAVNGTITCTGLGTSGYGFLGVILVIYLAFLVVSIVAAVKIVTKAGFSGWWVLVAFVPLVGAIMVLVFAFSTWPVTREVARLRAQTGSLARYAPPPGYAGAPGPFGPVSGVAGPPGTAPGAGLTPEGPWDPWGPALPPFGAGPPATTPGPPDVPPPTAHPPAGWYPAGDGRQRYWDGTAWTDHFA